MTIALEKSLEAQIKEEVEKRKAAGDLQNANASKVAEDALQWFLNQSLKLLAFLVLIAKLMSDPTDWSGEALAQSVGQGCVWFGQGVSWVVSGAWQVGSAVLASM